MKHQINFIEKPDTLESNEMRQIIGGKLDEYCFIFRKNKKWVCSVFTCESYSSAKKIKKQDKTLKKDEWHFFYKKSGFECVVFK